MTPCTGKALLFESRRPEHHIEAAALCAKCPAIAACEQNLRNTIAAYGPPLASSGPRGTWAGKLIGPPLRARAA